MKPGHRYQAFVEGFASTTPCLPLMHVTFGRGFVSILDSGRIEPGERDKVLEQELSFHFYGQPSYRPKPTGTYGRSVGSALYCFVLDFNALPKPSSLLPFDSGGYASLMKAHCDGLDLTDFLLPPSHDAPGKVVSALFGSNSNYFGMNVRSAATSEVATFDLHSQGLIRLYNTDGPVPYDQRAGSIEVHYDAPITLTSDNLLGIIAPDIVCEEPELKAFAAAHDADLIDYSFDHEEPSVRQRQIRDAAQKWLASNSYFESIL